MSDPLDVARYIFTNDESELRSGWRVLIFVVLWALAEMGLAGIIKTLATLFPSLSFLGAASSGTDDSSNSHFVSLWIDRARDFTSVVIATAVCARALERRSFSSVGFKLHRGCLKDFALGSLLGSSSLAIGVAIGAATGALTFTVSAQSGTLLVQGFFLTLIFFVVSGGTEELLFRGFPFQALEHNLGGAAALGLTSTFFGLAHLGNENASTFSTLNTILAGVWLGLAYLMTRSLWLATALHYSWNFAMVFVFGLPVSGFTSFDQYSWLRGHPGGPMWISGGSYGPEAGVGATAALVLSTLVMWKSGLFGASSEMLEATKHGKREPEIVSIIPPEEQGGAPMEDLDNAQ